MKWVSFDRRNTLAERFDLTIYDVSLAACGQVPIGSGWPFWRGCVAGGCREIHEIIITQCNVNG